jgi:esterase/lipase superfamily enzyme
MLTDLCGYLIFNLVFFFPDLFSHQIATVFVYERDGFVYFGSELGRKMLKENRKGKERERG